MGGKHSKDKENQRVSVDTQEPDRLGASSLDLIYVDDYFSNAKYLGQLEKHEKEKLHSTSKKHEDHLKFHSISEPNLHKKSKNAASLHPHGKSVDLMKTSSPSPSEEVLKDKATPHPTGSSLKVTPHRKGSSLEVIPSPTGSSLKVTPGPDEGSTKPPTQDLSATLLLPDQPRSTSLTSSTDITASQANKVDKPSSVTSGASPESPSKNSNQGPQSDPSSVSPEAASPVSNPPETATKSELSKSEVQIVVEAENEQDQGQAEEGHGPSPPSLSSGIPPSTKARKQRSTFTSSGSSAPKSSSTSEREPSTQLRSKTGPWSSDDITRSRTKSKSNRPTSVGRNWAPNPNASFLSESNSSSSSSSARSRTATIHKSEFSTRGDTGGGGEMSGSSRSRSTKKKLVVRGLRNFVDTHKRSAHSLWEREFPQKSRFHPDNYIYEWNEGPKAPPRPCSAMAKCKRHGGRCDDCGIFSSDICQSCRKCELDCCCVKAPPCPDMYSEVFGDGWKKTCKVLCDLTEHDKSKPVGGTAFKRRQNCCASRCNNGCHPNKLYQSQIDVMNPYSVPLTDDCGCGVPRVMPQYPMCAPPPLYHPFMSPMPYMPMMMPPQIPYLPQYDPYCGQAPYPPLDSFMPVQNY